jgi:hypothetical protein
MPMQTALRASLIILLAGGSAAPRRGCPAPVAQAVSAARVASAARPRVASADPARAVPVLGRHPTKNDRWLAACVAAG